MSKLKIRYAGVPYYDRTRPLELGELAPEGTELEFVPFHSVGKLFRVVVEEMPFDIAEMSLSTLALLMSRGTSHLVGLPIFPSRAFRHSQVYVHERSGIERPEDLRGKNVGIPEYQMTAAVWIRAFLEHDYGVKPSELHWWTGGLTGPAYTERLRHAPPPGVTIDRIPPERWLEEMLEHGDLDAFVTAQPPTPFRERKGVRRLFTNYRAVESEYYARTGYFPIMHTVAMKRDVYEANPWLAVSVLEAFEQARRQARARLRDLDTLAVMHPWIADEVDAITAQFGGSDPFVYGFQANLHTVTAACRYSYEQGLAERDVDPREIFAPETHDWQAPGVEDEDAA